MAGTEPAYTLKRPPALYPHPHNMHIPRHHARGHEAAGPGSGEPRVPVRSILLSGGSRPARARTNHNAEGATGSDPSPSRLDHTRETQQPAPNTTRDDGALAEARRGPSDEQERERDSAAARPSSSTSASIHLEEDLAAALASSPTPSPTPAPAAAMSHRRPRMQLELPAPDPALDALFAADRKLALEEGTSPKPCIVPGNALHLIDDDPAAPRSQTPPSVIIVTEDGEEEDDDDDYEDGQDGAGRTSSQPPVRPTGPRVRFRSRVRITSGVHRHRHSMTATPCSSASDSPSSSISAPLRYQADEHGAWGPLGKRLSMYAAGGGWPRRTQDAQQAPVAPVIGPVPPGRMRGGKAARAYHERTPLLRPGRQRSYTDEEDEETQTEEELGPEERASRTAALRREEEAVFGKWPWRILNRHWWWWHLEPVLCCCCSDESDYEEF